MSSIPSTSANEISASATNQVEHLDLSQDDDGLVDIWEHAAEKMHETSKKLLLANVEMNEEAAKNSITYAQDSIKNEKAAQDRKIADSVTGVVVAASSASLKRAEQYNQS